MFGVLHSLRSHASQTGQRLRFRVESSAIQMPLIEDTIIAEIIDAYEIALTKGMTPTMAYITAAKEVGVDASSVRYHVKQLKSTVALAKLKIKAKASAMVDRIIEKAPTSELIDILSRPNIGVLEPAQKGGQGSGGFMLTVAMDSCGAVRATAAMLPDAPAALPPARDLVDMNIIDSEGVPDEEAPRPAPSRTESLRQRLAAARAGDGRQPQPETEGDAP